jgi:hypothetical protein
MDCPTIRREAAARLCRSSQKYQARPGKNDKIITISMKLSVSLYLSLWLCLGCANRALVKGALSPEERQEYVEQTGALIPADLKQAFIEGIADTGMTKEMVVFLYGQPDRTQNNRYGIIWSTRDSTPSIADMRDSLWDYFTSDSSKVKRGLVFRGDSLVRIHGDRSH